MRFLCPSNPLISGKPDEQFVEECEAAASMGIGSSIFSFEQFLVGEFRPIPELRAEEALIFRGWMMKPQEYSRLHQAIRDRGAVPLTSPEQYELCHYLPRWYPLLAEFTPETLFFDEHDNIARKLETLGWETCFLKDYVKSVSTAGGSFARELSEIPTVLTRMRTYRGEIEGGVCARRIEDFEPDSEERYFIFRAKAFSRNGAVPEAVGIAAQRISSPFFSVDVARRRDGVLRIIELGDGQVSDRKKWSAKDVIEIIQKETPPT